MSTFKDLIDIYTLQLLKKLGGRGIKLLFIFFFVLGGLVGLVILNTIFSNLPEVWQAGLRLICLSILSFILFGFTLISLLSSPLSIELSSVFSHHEAVKNFASSLKEKALEDSRQGDNHTALRRYYEANDMFRSIGYERAVIATHLSIARTLKDLERMNEAKNQAKLALKMSQLGNHTDFEIDALFAIGECFHYQSNLEHALYYYEQVLKMAKRDGKLEYIVLTLDLVGTIHGNHRKFEQMLGSYEEAEEANQALAEKYSRSQIQQRSINRKYSILLGQIHALVELGRFEEAEYIYERIQSETRIQALMSHMLSNPEQQHFIQRNMREYRVVMFNTIGAIKHYRGDELGSNQAQEYYAEAESLYQQALKLSNRKQSTDWLQPAYNLALLAEKQGSLARANHLCTELLDYMSTASSKDYRFQVSVLALRGKVSFKQGSFKRAIGDLEKAVEQAELVRVGLQVEPESRLIFQEKWIIPYRLLIIAYVKAQRFTKACEMLELVKSRTFIEQLSKTPVRIPTALPQDFVQNEKALYQAIGELDLTFSSAAIFESQMSQLREFDKELAQLYDEMARVVPEYIALKQGKPLNYEGIHKTLLIES